jgi:nitrite reductase/ring-hydroxylating ferredoxin subunit
MTPLCSLAELAEGTCLEFESQGEPCFLLRHDGSLAAYRNRCPHRGVTLNWQPGDFLSVAGDEIRCATHDARFRPTDGLCTAGPCVGKRLIALPVVVRDGVVYLCG